MGPLSQVCVPTGVQKGHSMWRHTLPRPFLHSAWQGLARLQALAPISVLTYIGRFCPFVADLTFSAAQGSTRHVHCSKKAQMFCITFNNLIWKYSIGYKVHFYYYQQFRMTFVNERKELLNSFHSFNYHTFWIRKNDLLFCTNLLINGDYPELEEVVF